MICNVCSINAFVLFDESKRGEKLKIEKLIKLDKSRSIKSGINNQIWNWTHIIDRGSICICVC